MFLRYLDKFALDAGAAMWDTAAYPPQPLCKEYLVALMEIGHLRRGFPRSAWSARSWTGTEQEIMQRMCATGLSGLTRCGKKYLSASQLCRDVPPTLLPLTYTGRHAWTRKNKRFGRVRTKGTTTKT